MSETVESFDEEPLIIDRDSDTSEPLGEDLVDDDEMLESNADLEDKLAWLMR